MSGVKHKNGFKEFYKKLKESSVEAALIGTVELGRQIQKKTTVLTGNLKGSIQPSGEALLKTGLGFETRATVETKVEYAYSEEYGRRDQPSRRPKKMFSRGASAAKKTLPRILSAVLHK